MSTPPIRVITGGADGFADGRGDGFFLGVDFRWLERGLVREDDGFGSEDGSADVAAGGVTWSDVDLRCPRHAVRTRRRDTRPARQARRRAVTRLTLAVLPVGACGL